MKSELRRTALELRKKHADDAQCDILAPLFELPEFNAAKTVAVYLPLPGEPDTEAVCALCHARGVKIAVPAWDAEKREYRFCELRPGAVLRESNFGVREPLDQTAVETAMIDFFLVPGLMFDAAGNRLGHGKGFYDRLLAPRRAGSFVCGIAFGWQMSDTPIPAEAHDVVMDRVVFV